MPRHPRVHAPGLLYHLIARGNNGQEIFLEQADYESFLGFLRSTRERYPFYLYAYVLLPNHFHLLVEVIKTSTSRLMQSLLTGYARYFNRVHARSGHLFQGRYKAVLCERESYLVELVRYIHLNPVRARLVRRPGEWRWTGHREYLGLDSPKLIDVGPVLGLLKTPAQYETFIREGLKVGYRKEWHPKESAPFLGNKDFVKQVEKRGKSKQFGSAVSLKAIWGESAKAAGISPEVLRYGGRSMLFVFARNQFICRAVLEEGYLASEVAVFLGRHPSNISRALAVKQG